MSENSKQPNTSNNSKKSFVSKPTSDTENKLAKEYGGRKDGLEPTRYGDWEKNGRCIDF